MLAGRGALVVMVTARGTLHITVTRTNRYFLKTSIRPKINGQIKPTPQREKGGFTLLLLHDGETDEKHVGQLREDVSEMN